MHGAAKQTIQAQISGEAEAYGAAPGASPGVLMFGMIAWIGMPVLGVRLSADSKAAESMITRIGVGGERHIGVARSWIQRLCDQGRVASIQCPGEMNGADLNTKVHAKDKFAALCRMIGVRRMVTDDIKEAEIGNIDLGKDEQLKSLKAACCELMSVLRA